ncbi:endolytic transglycosylase MltG [Hahella aquimaris]|uniref:endolytic transglycosylase MltG n=1 Tax=Hahella sp. HNIBRBA332 TaxID=3015983 RepID=UPI00273BFBA5|nr:endolytic transglycosylase MltG [Hahella sp. HNIBRBA332]WLQ15284.1 endolytic transglycosylase MltG [Hahella sp. HNIBRBA332]
MSSKNSKKKSTKKSRFSLRKFVLKTLLAVFLLSSAVVAGAYYYGRYLLSQPLPVAATTTIEVKRGDSLRKVADRMAEEGVLENAEWFYWYGRLSRKDKQLVAGEYLLEPGKNSIELFALLTSGNTLNYALTIIEGWNLKDVLRELDNHPKLEKTIGTQDPAQLAKLLGMNYSHAEGLLFPDTYFYKKGTRDIDLLTTAHRRMVRILEDEWSRKSAWSAAATPYEALVLASIVEKETSVDSERGRISGVFTLRLEKGMRLQTDPTVIYGMGDKYEGNLRRKDLREATAYNTYVIKGLPPTPIAMPGRASIHAALHPEITGDLYFVARGDGTHEFSKTHDAHVRAVRKYQLRRREDYRSTQ